MALRFLQYDLGILHRGQIVEVALRGNAANVLLMDRSNFAAFKAGRKHRYYGGLAKRSPISLLVPTSGHWYVVVHLGGLRGNVSASVNVLPGALPEIRTKAASPLERIRDAADAYEPPEEEALPAISPDEKAYDVFISHASEDKENLVRPLARALRDRGLAVWYDEFELGLGDSLRRKIDSGLARSRFGLVVLSRAFFAKEWPQRELDGLVVREVAEGQQVILPIWHGLTSAQVAKYSPTLADKVALHTRDTTIDEIADQVASAAKRTQDPIHQYES